MLFRNVISLDKAGAKLGQAGATVGQAQSILGLSYIEPTITDIGCMWSHEGLLLGLIRIF